MSSQFFVPGPALDRKARGRKPRTRAGVCHLSAAALLLHLPLLLLPLSLAGTEDWLHLECRSEKKETGNTSLT